MRISLISPFRTLLNIDTDLAFARAHKFSALLEQVVLALGTVKDVSYGTDLTPPPEKPFTKYRNLSQTHTTWFTTPLAHARLSDDLVEAMEKHAERVELRALRHMQRPTSARIDIHDNTLAVLTLDLEVEADQLKAAFESAVDLENYLTAYAAACARYCESAVMQPFLEALERACSAAPDFPDAAKLLRRPKQFLAFNDLENHEFPVWNEAEEPSLWTHRVYHVGTLSAESSEALTPLLRLPAAMPPYHIGQGSSWLWDSAHAATLNRINAACQYFYCMVEALNLSQKRLLRQLAGGSRRFDINSAYARYDRQENMLTEMKNELLDFTVGLQGDSREIFDAVQQAFRTHELIAAMEQRSGLLREKIDRASARRSLFQQRLLAFSLVLLGAIQIISLVMQIFNYPNEDWNNDRIPGLTDLAMRVPFDLAMNIVLLAIVIFALVWSWRTRRPH